MKATEPEDLAPTGAEAPLPGRLYDSGLYIAREGDRWFVQAIVGAQAVGTRLRAAFGAAGQRVVTTIKRPPATRRARVHRLLVDEARKPTRSLTDDELEDFADKITTLIDLVLGGEVAVGDVAFETLTPTQPPQLGDYPAAVYPSMQERLGEP